MWRMLSVVVGTMNRKTKLLNLEKNFKELENKLKENIAKLSVLIEEEDDKIKDIHKKVNEAIISPAALLVSSACV